jgi:protein-S-isoprenylcysteine O-methyltransferase Ste14
MNYGHDGPAYGLWGLVIFNSAVFIVFAFGFFRPRTKCDWRTLSSFSAFIVALFAEMYGFPLTIYLLSGWLQTTHPGVDILSHDAGHLWYSLIGFGGDPHFNPIHIAGNVLAIAGFLLLSAAWKVLWSAQRERHLATTGPYSHVRHPQYVGFIAIMLGFLVMWPTLLTLLMFPALAVMYVRLALREEREAAAAFEATWREYAACTPPWFPRLLRRRSGMHAESRS